MGVLMLAAAQGMGLKVSCVGARARGVPREIARAHRQPLRGGAVSEPVSTQTSPQLQGIGASPGIAVGRAFVLDRRRVRTPKLKLGTARWSPS